MNSTGKRVRTTARAAQDYFEANPLMIGAVGLGIGLILGAMFPLSRREREIFEPIGENLRESAVRQGAEVMRQVARGVEDLSNNRSIAVFAPESTRKPPSGCFRWWKRDLWGLSDFTSRSSVAYQFCTHVGWIWAVFQRADAGASVDDGFVPFSP